MPCPHNLCSQTHISCATKRTFLRKFPFVRSRTGHGKSIINNNWTMELMRRLLILSGLGLILTGGLATANAITFTNDATISSSNLDYDGADVVISNCTVT